MNLVHEPKLEVKAWLVAQHGWALLLIARYSVQSYTQISREHFNLSSEVVIHRKLFYQSLMPKSHSDVWHI